MTTRSQSEADSIAAAGFSDVYQPVKSYLDDLDIFLQSQVQELEPEVTWQMNQMVWARRGLISQFLRKNRPPRLSIF